MLNVMPAAPRVESTAAAPQRLHSHSLRPNGQGSRHCGATLGTALSSPLWGFKPQKVPAILHPYLPPPTPPPAAPQIAKEVKRFAKAVGLTCVAVYGGSGVANQITELKRGTEIVVCTPGRMIDILGGCRAQGRAAGSRPTPGPRRQSGPVLCCADLAWRVGCCLLRFEWQAGHALPPLRLGALPSVQ